MFVETFGDEGEHWDSFRVVEGEFPEEKDLEKYDGFVISGSSHDSFENDPWILRLCEIVKKLDEMKKKVLGICFGHQVLFFFSLLPLFRIFFFYLFTNLAINYWF